MTEKEYKVERARLEISDSQSKLREAQRNFHEGQKRELAKIEQAKADAAKEISRLQEEIVRAQNRIEIDRKWLEHMEAEQARGFEA